LAPLDIVRRTEDVIRRQPFESPYVYDQNGVLLLKKDGAQFEVEILTAEMKLLPGAIVTHNHPWGLNFRENDPRSEGDSFSFDDIRTAAIGNVAEMRTVTPRVRYSMRPAAAGWPEPALIESAFNLADAEIQTRFRADIQVGRMTQPEAEARHYDEIWKLVARRLGLIYQKEHS
jgi:hypothetical protein